MKYPAPGMGYIYLSCWPDAPHGNPQTAKGVAKPIGCFPQTDSKAPLLKIIPTYLTEQGEMSWYLVRGLLPLNCVMVLEGTIHAIRGKT